MTNEEAIRVLGRMLDEFCNEDAWIQECKDAVDMAIEALKAQPETSTEIQEILNYLDTTLHPIVSPDNWYVYAELHDMVSMLPSVQPKHDQNTPQKQPDLETLGVKTGKTCADAISRQDAIEELSYLQTYLFDSRDHDNKVSLEDVRYAIEQLPSAKPKQRWIPVSERMPEPRIDVWCNSDMGQMVGYYEENVETWYGRDYLELMVTAWMPLPEPYRAKRRADE